MNDSPQHYFSETPLSQTKSKTIEINLAGKQVKLNTQGGVFSPQHLDQGTQTLLTKAPAVSTGPVLDLGCGWGPIALQAALEAPEATVWAIDVNARARALTRDNANRLGLSNVLVGSPDDVPAELEFAEIRSNPPIRVGKAALHDILRRWIPRLAPGGVAYFVVAKHLGAESLMRWLGDEFPFLEVERYARDKGFHVIRAIREQ